MNLKQFADMAGCTVVLCGPGWGGRYGYTTSDAPNCTTCGFKTQEEARQRWLEDTFGEGPGVAVQKMLSSTGSKNSKQVPQSSPDQLDRLVMQNDSMIEFVKHGNEQPFVGTGKIFFCPECGCQTNEKTQVLMCDCFAYAKLSRPRH